MVKRLNNKGNTLAIVLIGIFILSILGTLILGVTSTNYNMKLNDKKSEMVFYYSEKAADLLYTHIGDEVMGCVKDSYSNVLENAVLDGTGNYVYKDAATLTSEFKTQYLDSLKSLYPKEDTQLNTILSRLEGKINSDLSTVSGYTFRVIPITDTDIEYDTTTDPVTGAVTINTVNLNNVCVKCTATATGNSVNIANDFVVSIPNVNIDFSDTMTSINTENLYSYAVLAQGKGVTGDTPVLSVKSNKEANVDGNIYVGADNSSAVTSVLVEANAKLNCKAKVLYSEGRFVIKGGTAELNSSTGLGEEFNQNTLQFFANNISTEEGPSVLNIKGNTIVKDDLEINADNSNVLLSGNYFGYGHRGTFGTDISGNTVYNENITSSSVSDITTEEASSPVSYEHLDSSAIIVNAKEAKVDLANIKNLVVAGRAYIDLDENPKIDTSYMTGESISVKGNQIAYQADNALAKGLTEEFLPTDLHSGMSFVALQAKMGSNKDAYYSTLGLDSDKVIAKNVNGKVYFYLKPMEPSVQTEYYKGLFATNTPIRNELREVYRERKLSLNLPNEGSSNIYTVGTYFGFNVNNFTFYPKTTMKALNSTTEGSLGFENLLEDINNRKSSLIPKLDNVDSKADKYLGKNLWDEPVDTSDDNKTPFEFYLSPEFVGHTHDFETNDDIASNPAIVTSLESAGITTTGQNIRCIIDNKNTSTLVIGSGTGELDMDMGVIITTRPVVVKQNFTGLIITGDTLTVEESANITANYNLTKILFSSYGPINTVLNSGLGNQVDQDMVIVDVTSEGLSYEDLVKKSNWRKNAN